MAILRDKISQHLEILLKPEEGEVMLTLMIKITMTTLMKTLPEAQRTQKWTL